MQNKLDKKTRILFILILVLIVISVAFTYYRSVVAKDFEVFYDDYGEGEELLEEEAMIEGVVIEEATDEEVIVEEEF